MPLDLEKTAMFPRGCSFGCSNSGEKARKRDKGRDGGGVSLKYLLSELSDDDINAQ